MRQREHRTLSDILLTRLLAQSVSVRSSIAKTDDYSQCAIDLTKLAKREQPMRFAEPARIDGAELLDQHPRPLAVDLHLRPE